MGHEVLLCMELEFGFSKSQARFIIGAHDIIVDEIDPTALAHGLAFRCCFGGFPRTAIWKPASGVERLCC